MGDMSMSITSKISFICSFFYIQALVPIPFWITKDFIKEKTVPEVSPDWFEKESGRARECHRISSA
jgi:hypothetical protein